jgi:hypothetical protein
MPIPIRLSAEKGRIYLFHRGVSQDPNYLYSDDDARSWHYGGKLFIGRRGYSPYAKYASNGRDAIHFVATEDHPRNFDNSLYHGFIRGGNIHLSDGTVLAPLATSSNTTVHAWDLTRIYQGGPGSRGVDDGPPPRRAGTAGGVVHRASGRGRFAERAGRVRPPVPLRALGRFALGGTRDRLRRAGVCMRARTITPAWARLIRSTSTWSSSPPTPTR